MTQPIEKVQRWEERVILAKLNATIERVNQLSAVVEQLTQQQQPKEPSD
jgi:hypothetical protein